jgi:hypothetical protein
MVPSIIDSLIPQLRKTCATAPWLRRCRSRGDAVGGWTSVATASWIRWAGSPRCRRRKPCTWRRLLRACGRRARQLPIVPTVVGVGGEVALHPADDRRGSTATHDREAARSGPANGRPGLNRT